MTKAFVLAIVCTLLIAATGPCALAALYYHALAWDAQGSYTDLGTLPGGTDSWAYGNNQLGQAVGWSTDADGVRHAVRWDADGAIVDLGAGTAYAVNDSGVAVGECDGLAMLWEADGTPHVIGSGVAYAINAAGLATGDLVATAYGGAVEDHMFLYSLDGGLTDIGKPTGSLGARGRGINKDGWVVGTSFVNSDYYAAFVWNSTARWSTISGGRAYDINDNAVVVGNDVIGPAFIWSANGGLTEIPDFTAYALNNAGFVAGETTSAWAGVWSAGTGLLSLTQPTSSLRSRAYDINDNGQTVGFALYVPGADPLLILGTGLAGLGILIRRRVYCL